MAQPPETPQAPPMVKEETRKDDGRLLIYYSFAPPEEPAAGQGTPDGEEDADV